VRVRASDLQQTQMSRHCKYLSRTYLSAEHMRIYGEDLTNMFRFYLSFEMIIAMINCF
jgi:hypothetical protein